MRRLPTLLLSLWACHGAGPGVFAASVVEFTPGEGAGYGDESYPDNVLGMPCESGASPSLDVLSLGRGGEIVLSFGDQVVVDGSGPDLIVFENPFPGWLEPGIVGASEDGEHWTEWPCDAEDLDGGYPGCAGVTEVNCESDDFSDLETSGGDGFDLSDIGLSEARYIRVRDAGVNDYSGNTGGFDLDGLVLIHTQSIDDSGDGDR